MAIHKLRHPILVLFVLPAYPISSNVSILPKPSPWMTYLLNRKILKSCATPNWSKDPQSKNPKPMSHIANPQSQIPNLVWFCIHGGEVFFWSDNKATQAEIGIWFGLGVATSVNS